MINVNYDFITKVMKLVCEYDFIDSLQWNEDLNFCIICNDVFYPAADAEPITREDLPL